MINYIIALTSHARRNNLMSLCSYQHSQWWYYNHHEFILDWLCLHSWTQTLCIKQGESDLHLPRLSSCHAIPPQFSSVKVDGQQMWVRQKRICSYSTFDRAEQFFIAESHCFSRIFSLWVLCDLSCKAFWSAMKNCSALSNVEQEQILSVSLTFVVHLLLQMKTVEECHGKS